MRYLFLSLLLAFSSIAVAQPDTLKFRSHYFGMFLSGAQIGCTNCSLSKKITVSAYVINGLQLTKRFSAGIGVGFDSYEEWRTVPFFLHVSQKLFGRKNGLCLQLNGGYAIGLKDKLGYELPSYNEQGGLMVHYAITYQLEMDRVRILFSAGMKQQRVTYSYRYEWGSQYNELKNILDLNRAVIQIGFGWK
jgi:hypothetical protein